MRNYAIAGIASTDEAGESYATGKIVNGQSVPVSLINLTFSDYKKFWDSLLGEFDLTST